MANRDEMMANKRYIMTRMEQTLIRLSDNRYVGTVDDAIKTSAMLHELKMDLEFAVKEIEEEIEAFNYR